MSNYRKGRLEYRVAKQLREWGWTVWRFAGSKPLDLLAIRGDEIRFIECKNYYDLKTEDVKKLAKWCKKLSVLEHIYLVKPLPNNPNTLVVLTISAAGKERVEFFDEVFM